MRKKYLKLSNISSYKLALQLSNKIWAKVSEWNYFGKNTVGIQLVRATDSISANIAEGFGRYHKKDKIKFYRYGLGSLYEALDWNLKAKCRGLISISDYETLNSSLLQIKIEIYNLINFTNSKLNK